MKNIPKQSEKNNYNLVVVKSFKDEIKSDLMKRPLIIAHAANHYDLITQSLKKGADLAEIDVSERIIFSKFSLIHQGILGKFGFGPPLQPILTPKFSSKLLLDLKHAAISFTFEKNLSQLLEKSKIKKINLCGRDWDIIFRLAQKFDSVSYFTVITGADLKKFIQVASQNPKPKGIILPQKFLNSQTLEFFNSNSLQIYTFFINNASEVKRMVDLGVDGIITDNVKMAKSTLSQLKFDTKSNQV